MALSRFGQQAIIWINDGLITDAYMRHSTPMSWLLLGKPDYETNQ